MPLARANSEGSVTVVTAASIPPHSPRHGLARNDFGRATERDSELHTTPGWNAQPEGLDVATAAASRVWGDGLKSAVVRAWAEFVVEAHNADGSRRVVGGESAAFFISIRGWAERVRARVKDNGDGSYTVRYKPHISGQYTIAISLYGARVPGSPFACGVTTPTPCAAQCVVRGKALHQAIARDKHTFEVQFRDNQGLPCHAEELDVYVEVIDDSASIPERALDGRHGTVDCRSGNGRTAQDDAGAVASRPSTPLMTEGCDEATSVPRMRMAECVVTSQQPLVVRSGHELDSERVGQVRPGSRVYLLEVHEMSTREQGANKDVRACVAVDEVDADNEESIAATVTKWRELFPVRYSWLDDDLTRAGMAASRNASRSGSPRAGQLSSVPTPRKVPLGWVTMAKAGRELLTPRTKLGAGDRQNHIRAWMRRLAVDKTLDARVRGSAANAMDAASSKSAKRERAYASLRNAASTRHDQGLIFRNEMSSDPKGIGFAYGGVDPGRLTHGHVIETHKVHYSITGTGAYNLHVGLRQQAMALPGSPFKLVVIPGPAHAIATAFPKASLPLRGVVGFEPENGCKIILESVDKMGNRCFEGGATVNCTCESEHVTTHCVDQGDGTYALEWRSTTSGTYEVSVHIDGLAIDGAPASMTLVADRPELEKTEISGSGLSKVAAGKAANVSITLMDTHSNIAGRASSASFLFGMTLCSSGNKELKDRWKCDASDPYEGGWLNDDMFQMVFVAENTGTLDLHLWCCPDGDEKAAHLPLPGSPFRIECVAGKASASGSLIDGFHKVETIIDKYGKKGAGKVEQRPNLADDGTATVIAGDSIVLKPLIRDQYHNPASAEQGSLSVTLTAPDENTIDLVPTILARGGLTTYDVRYEPRQKGSYVIHVTLSNDEITGSPVLFDCLPSIADLTKSHCIVPDPPLFAHVPYEIVLVTVDRYGNELTAGGANVTGRLQSASMPSGQETNLEVIDSNNGKYRLKLTMLGAAEVKVIVAIAQDKALQGGQQGSGGGDLTPLSLTFARGDAASKAQTQQVVQASQSEDASKEASKEAEADVEGSGGGTMSKPPITRHKSRRMSGVDAATLAAAAAAMNAAGEAESSSPALNATPI